MKEEWKPEWQETLERCAKKKKVNDINLFLGHIISSGGVAAIKELKIDHIRKWIELYDIFLKNKLYLSSAISISALQASILRQIKSFDENFDTWHEIYYSDKFKSREIKILACQMMAKLALEDSD